MTRINKKRFKEACKGSGGVQAVIAKALEVTRGTVSVYLKKNPDMKELLDEEGNKIIDTAEHNIDRDIVAGDVDTSKWALTNRKKGKARGYGPKQEVEIGGDLPVTFNLIEKSVEEIKSEKLRDKSKASSDAEGSR